MVYNSRITPINTVATSFVTKLCGKPTWDGLSSNQVFAGWIFDVPYWETVKMIEIKEKKAQELLGINGKWASFDDFWDNYNNYKLDAPLKKAYKDGDTKLQKQLRDADEKFNIIRMLYGGEMLKICEGQGGRADKVSHLHRNLLQQDKRPTSTRHALSHPLAGACHRVDA